ncbi:hypothetical protein MC885_021492 [Smutsia gigantea]|nr:hypothetical protein MC885_021492 [Smutsia gigantea]
MVSAGCHCPYFLGRQCTGVNAGLGLKGQQPMEVMEVMHGDEGGWNRISAAGNDWRSLTNGICFVVMVGNQGAMAELTLIVLEVSVPVCCPAQASWVPIYLQQTSGSQGDHSPL